MGATNTTTGANRTFFKLKEDERPESETKGQMRFFKQEKKADKWGDGESFNQLSGIVSEVKTKEYEYQGEMKKQLVVIIKDVDETMEFSIGLRAMTAQGILNTLAADNGMDLTFVCGKPKERNGKWYPTLYINKPGDSNEERRTNWKFQPDQMPKVTTTTDEEGNKIKKGQKAADEFWLKVLGEIQTKMGVVPQETTTTAANTGDGTQLPF